MGNLQIVQVQKPGFQSIWCEDKISNCASWSGCVKHVENVHYLHDPKDVKKLSQTLKLIGTIWKIKRRCCVGGHPVTRAEHVG